MPIACGNSEGSSVFRHPQPARTFEYIAFEPGKSTVAVRLGGKWTKQDRVLIGFVDQETDLEKAREIHPADLGYFFSIRSSSIVGCDGTNFAWHWGLVEGWAQQLREQGCEYAMEKLTNCTFSDYYSGRFLNLYDGSLAMCVKLTKDLEFDVFVRCQHDGYQLAQSSPCFVEIRGELATGKGLVPSDHFHAKETHGATTLCCHCLEISVSVPTATWVHETRPPNTETDGSLC